MSSGCLKPKKKLSFERLLNKRSGFKPGLGQVSQRDETFVITRQLPETAGVFQYHVRSEIDGHNRVGREDQLADFQSD